MSLKHNQEEIYDYLVAQTASSNGRNAFIGYLPDITNAWSFEPLGSTDSRHYPCVSSTSEIITLKGRFSERRSAYAWNDLMASLLNDANPEDFDYLNWIKFRSIYNVYPVNRVLYGSKRITFHYETELRFQLVSNKKVNWFILGKSKLGKGVLGPINPISNEIGEMVIGEGVIQ